MLKYALDIGSYSTRILVADVGRDGFRIKGSVSLPTEGYFGGVIVNNRRLLFSILEVLKRLEKEIGERPKRILVNCSHAGSKFYHVKEYFLRENSEFPLTSRELERYKLQALNNHLPLEEKEIYVQVAEYILDGQKGIVNPQGMLAKNLEIALNIITIPLTVYNNILSFLGEVGLEVETIIPEIVAKGSYLLSQEELIAGAMILDIGWGTAKCAIFKNRILKFAKIFESELNSIFEILQSIYHLNFEEAEEILRESFLTETVQLSFSTRTSLENVSVESVRNIVEKKIKKIIYSVKRIVDEGKLFYYIPEGIIITGGSIIEFPGLSNIASEIIRQPVKIVKKGNISLGEEYDTAIGMLKYFFVQKAKTFQSDSHFNFFKRITARMRETINRYF